MPRTSDLFLDCVFYIYNSKDAAQQNDERVGGTGFIAAAPLENNPQHYHFYLVTAAHVIRGARTPFVRFNTRGVHGVEILEISADKWKQHPNGDDVTVCRIVLPTLRLRTLGIEIDRFVSHSLVGNEDIGIGDDVFMVGRFVQHSGNETQNIPTLRFGNISAMPRQPIIGSTGIRQESFLVECRSVPGYSGSPVFVYKNDSDTSGIAQTFFAGFWLLGIDWCHLIDTARVRDEETGRPDSEAPSFVRVNTGMAGVIPAWKILEAINQDEFLEERRKEDRQLTNARRNSGVEED